MGSLAFDAGKENTAESWLNESLKRNPNSEMCRIKLAEIYRVRSKHDQALTQIQTCLKRNRNSVPARRALIMWLQEKGFVALATQESYVLNQISNGSDKRIAPPSSMQVATAVKGAPTVSAKKEEAPPTKSVEPKHEAKQAESKPPEKQKAPPSIVATLMKRAAAPPKKKEEQPAKPVVAKPAPVKAVVKQPVVVQKPKKLPEPKKEEPKQEVAKASPPKRIEKPTPPPMPMPTPVVAKEPKRSRTGLVPPPPPIMPPFPGMFPPPMGYNANAPMLQTHASIKKAKPKAEPKEPANEHKETKDTASVDEEGEGDFLIDWAGSTKKKKK